MRIIKKLKEFFIPERVKDPALIKKQREIIEKQIIMDRCMEKLNKYYCISDIELNDFCCGAARIKCRRYDASTYKTGTKYNYINMCGCVISDTWFDYAEDFSDDVGYVAIGDIYGVHKWHDDEISLTDAEYNYITLNGHMLFDNWYSYKIKYKNKNSVVYQKPTEYQNPNHFLPKYNIVDKNNNFIFDEWINEAFNISDNCIMCHIKNKGYNILNENTEYISEIWFDSWSHCGMGYIVSAYAVGKNILNRDGAFISKIWFEEIDSGASCRDEYKVKIKGKGWNYINKDGIFRFDEWYTELKSIYCNGLLKVGLKNKGYNFIGNDGKYLLSNWVKSVHKTNLDNIFILKLYNGKEKLFDITGTYTFEKEFDSIQCTNRDAIFRVWIQTCGYNFMNLVGKYISDGWFIDIHLNKHVIFSMESSESGLGNVKLDKNSDNWYNINIKGELCYYKD